jgi:serine/threonine protein kinase
MKRRSLDWEAIRELAARLNSAPPAEWPAILEGSGCDERHRRIARDLAMVDTSLLDGFVGKVLEDEIQIPSGLIPGYELLELSGIGGMGAIYTAVRKDDRGERVVAVKLVSSPEGDPKSIATIFKEQEILSRLELPMVARLYDWGIATDGRPFIVMEYVKDAKDLRNFCIEKELSTRARVEMILKVCEGIEIAHRLKIIHCDLKPQNILVADDGQIKIVDFGIARNWGNIAENLKASSLTLEYASPEALAGAELTAASDVYSLGVVLYEILTDHHPFHRAGMSTDAARLAAPLERPDPPSVRAAIASAKADRAQRVRSLRGDLDAITLKALAGEVEDSDRPGPQAAKRYASAGLLAADLKRWLDGNPVQAASGGQFYRLAKFARRQSRSLLVVVAVLAIIAFFVLGLVLQNRDLERMQMRSQRTSEFLIDLIEAADPLKQREPDLKVRDLLAIGERKLRSELQDEPEVRATLLATLGEATYSVGDYAGSKRLLEDSLALHRKSGEKETRESVETLGGISRANTYLGLHDQALRQIEEAIAASDALDDPGIRAALLAERGLQLLERDRFEEAERDFKEGIASAQKAKDPSQEAVLRNNLGLLYSDLTRPGEAEAEFLKAKRLHTVGRANLVEVASVDHNLAQHYLRTSDYAKAEAVELEALATIRKAAGPDHPDEVIFLSMLCSIQRRASKLSQALASCEEGLAIADRKLRKTDSRRASILGALAQVEMELERYPSARRRSEEVYAIRLEVDGERNTSTLLALASLGNLELETQNYAAAEQIYLKAIPMATAILGERHRNLCTLSSNLGNAQAKLGKLSVAESSLQRAIERCGEITGPESSQTVNARGVLAYVLMKQSRLPDAIVLFRQNMASYERQHGHRETFDYAVEVGNLARALQQARSFEEALKRCEEALSTFTALLGAESRRVQSTGKTCRQIRSAMR